MDPEGDHARHIVLRTYKEADMTDLMREACQEFGTTMRKATFEVFGERLYSTDRPIDFGLDDGDVITIRSSGACGIHSESSEPPRLDS